MSIRPSPGSAIRKSDGVAISCTQLIGLLNEHLFADEELSG